MRTDVLSQDEADARTQRLDDDRHARNVQDANALVETNCPRCSPERKRQMYQSEMNRLEKASLVKNGRVAESDQTAERSWGRRYIEDYATGLQLIFGLLCGLAMLVNNFIRLYADEPQHVADEFPDEIDTEKRSLIRRPRLENPPKHVSKKNDDTDAQRKSTQDGAEGLKRLRETLKLISFHNPGRHFKDDRKDDCIWIRMVASSHGLSETVASVKARLSILQVAMTMTPAAFRDRLEKFLRGAGFEI